MRPSLSDYRLPPGRHGIPPEEVKANQRWRLLAACAEVVAEGGYEALTVRAVTAAAGVSKSTFYEQFDGLSDCVRSTYEMATSNALAVTHEVCEAASGPAAALPEAVASVLDLLAREPALGHVLTDAALDDVQGLFPLRTQFAERCAALLVSAGGEGADRRLSLHRVRGTRGWLWEFLERGEVAALPRRAPELTQLLAP